MKEETFNRPKTKDFTIKAVFSSNKPNRIVHDSRDDARAVGDIIDDILGQIKPK